MVGQSEQYFLDMLFSLTALSYNSPQYELTLLGVMWLTLMAVKSVKENIFFTNTFLYNKFQTVE